MRMGDGLIGSAILKIISSSAKLIRNTSEIISISMASNKNLIIISNTLKLQLSEAMDMILRPEPPDESELEDEKFLEIYQEATDIYGLIHARFILSPKGLAIMRQKYLLGKFGTCPRVLCEKQNAIPVGMSEQIRTSRVKIYCPRCQDVYLPKKKCPDVDGAYFGCSFPQILLMAFQDLKPAINDSKYIPRLYGFKIYKKAGSKYLQPTKTIQLTHYNEDQLKKLKGKLDHKKVNNTNKDKK